MWKGIYGTYGRRFSIRKLGIRVEEGEKNIVVYRRGDVEKIVRASSDIKFLVHPVEPLNLPEEITYLLEINLSSPITVPPREAVEFYLTFPVEIGVFVSGKNSIKIIDIFSLTSHKFTLYGSVRSGRVCRYWKSNVYFSLPKRIDITREGVVKVLAINTTKEWVTVSKVVLSAWGMKIFFSEKLVCMNSVMKILSDSVAETRFIEKPLDEGMEKSIEIFKVKKVVIPLKEEKFVMEEGY